MTDSNSICFISLPAYGYFRSGSGPLGGGGSRQFNLLATALADRFDVHFIVGDYGQSVVERVEGVTLHRAYTPEKGSGLLSQIRKTETLFKALRRVDADVYSYCGFPHKAAVLNLLLTVLRKRGIYHIVADDNLGRHYESLSPVWQRLFVRALRDADAVIAQTDHQVEKLRLKFDVDSRRIPNGYQPVDEFVPYEDRDGFVWVGNINEMNKRPHRFLDAAERLPEERFTLVGPPDDDCSYVSLISERAASLSNVEYVGPVNPDDVHAYFRDPYALVNTSPFEGFPNTFLEAWRYGTPIVSLHVDPGRYVSFSDRTGGANGDFDRFVSILETVATDVGFRSSLGSQGKASFEDQYRLDVVSARYEDVIRDVLSR